MNDVKFILASISRVFITCLVVFSAVSCSKSNESSNATEDSNYGDNLPEELAEQLESIGYLQESDVPPSEKKISIYDPDRAQDGLNLYVSGHAPEAYLMDMEGKVLHTWSRPFDDIWPDAEKHFFAESHLKNSYRQFHLLPGGDIICIFELFGIVKLDKDSNVIWKFENVAHHDVDTDDQGNIYTLGKRIVMDEDTTPLKWWLYPTINILDKNGNLIRTIDVYKCFTDSQFRTLLKSLQTYGDMFHNNSIRVLDGSHSERLPAFRKGNILVSSRMTNAIYVIDPEKNVVVWMLRDLFRFQHDPHLLENGNILIFDNQSLGDRSRVIEFDPLTQEVIWEYDGGDSPFYSKCCSTSQRLPNGNTLITVTAQAKAIEVTPNGDIVWQFQNPASLMQDELAANLFELRRITPNYDFSWLEAEI